MGVIVYSTPTCPFCHSAKQYLTEKKVKFTSIDVSENQDKAQEMVQKSGQMGVPVIDIYGEIIVGFQKDLIDQALATK